MVTSSLVAIYKPTDTKQSKFNEKDWTDPNGKNVTPYEKSKTLAEKAAREYLAKLPENERFEFVTINPGFILGPNIHRARGSFTSGDVIKKFLTGKIPMCPLLNMGMVDIRDVAQAHLNAVLRPEADGHRFMLVGHSMWFNEMGPVLYKKFG